MNIASAIVEFFPIKNSLGYQGEVSFLDPQGNVCAKRGFQYPHGHEMDDSTICYIVQQLLPCLPHEAEC